MLLIVQGLCANLAPPARPFGLFAVADGLRGQHCKSTGGHEASRMAMETVADVLVPLLASPSHSTSYRISGGLVSQGGAKQPGGWYKALPSPESVIEQWLIEAVQQANSVIYHCNADYETDMASTLTVTFMYKHHVYVANVGDSRAYHYSPRKGIHRVTIDHTLAANLVDAHLFTPEEVYKSAKRKQFYRILGQGSSMRVDLSQHAVEVNDLILLCTNGLWHMLQDDKLAEILVQGGDPQKLARALVDAANLAGGEGNVSAVVVKVQ